MAEIPNLTILEHCLVAPPQVTASDAELSIPLTFFDTQFWNSNPMHELLFYEFRHSKTHFVENIIPSLKESLSFALKHFLPMAGNLIYDSESGSRELRYEIRDSVPLTFAESDDDFKYLVKNHPRIADRFYPLVPQLPPLSVHSSGKTKTPLFALQVTIFSNAGICVAWSYRHVLGDASTTIGFMKAWASIFSKSTRNSEVLGHNFVPVYDRSTIQDPFHLEVVLFNAMKMFKPQEPPSVTTILSNNYKVRATFNMSQIDIQKLKNLVLTKEPNPPHVSSLTVTCAYAWTCWLRSIDAVVKEIEGDTINNEPQFLSVPVDFRQRLDPPLPQTYFGNCVLPCIVPFSCVEVVGNGNEGFFKVAIQIGEAVKKMLNNKEGVVKGNWLSELRKIASGNILAVVGSPKYDGYDVDFGWGKANKFESLAVDESKAMSISKSRKFEGALELSLCLPSERMDAFVAFFIDGLKKL